MISILCPSRGRPELAKRMIDSVRDTSKGVHVILGLDSDDTSDYDKDIPQIVCHDKKVGQIWNLLYHHTTANIIMLGNDDLIFRTKDWDEYVSAAMPDNIPWLVWCQDGINGDKHAAFPFVNRKFIEAVGYYLPECFNFLYHDTWLFDIAKRAGCLTYLPDVLIEHKHFSVGAPFDETYRRHREGVQDKRMEDAFIFERTAFFREQAAIRIRNSLKGVL